MNKHKHPEIFQKKIYNRAYFEGWYYKQVTADGQHTISFIPGVNYEKSGGKGFIQCLHLNPNQELKAYNIDFPVESFSFQNKPFMVEIEKNHFSLDHLSVSLDSKDLKVSGNIKFTNLTPIQRSLFTPNIMGYFSYLPFMECNHGLISMKHDLQGFLNINGENIDFSGGKGYIEKDWGKSFPKNYVWIQSNHFEDESVALFCSVARIPFLGFSFDGFICNLIHKGKEYRFATYNGTKLVSKSIKEKNVHLIFENKGFHLEIEGEILLSEKLHAPKLGSMNKSIKEGLSGKVKLVLKSKSGRLILNSASQQCGMEIVEALEARR
jgi:hypothetical protein